MKIVALIASHKRDEILQDSITCLNPQVDDIVLVGTSDWIKEADTCNIAKRIAKKNDLIYVDHSNKVLGSKFQAALNKCRELSPDLVLVCGSDDLVSNDYVDTIRVYNEKRSSLRSIILGKTKWNAYNPPNNEICFFSYKERKDFIGAGRAIGADVLNKVDWQIFPTEGGVGSDLYSWNILTPHCKEKIDMYYGRLLSVKGNWSMLDTWEQMVNAPSLNVTKMTRSIDRWLEYYCPNIDFDKYKKKH